MKSIYRKDYKICYYENGMFDDYHRKIMVIRDVIMTGQDYYGTELTFYYHVDDKDNPYRTDSITMQLDYIDWMLEIVEEN